MEENNVNIEEYIEKVEESIKSVNNSYQQIRIADSNEVLYRERVWCYEFYHQMRLNKINELNKDIVINGEIDKSGHSIISKNINPDFIIHKQGDMTNNLIVMEVKIRFENKRNIKKDFITLSCMLNNHNYKRGIFIAININKSKLISILKVVLADLHCIEKVINKIIVFTKESNIVEKFSLKEVYNG